MKDDLIPLRAVNVGPLAIVAGDSWKYEKFTVPREEIVIKQLYLVQPMLFSFSPNVQLIHFN